MYPVRQARNPLKIGEITEEQYQRLRSGDGKAFEEAVESFIRLGVSITYKLSRNPNMRDDLIVEMLYFLTIGVQKIREGRLDASVLPKSQAVPRYLHVYIRGGLRKFISRQKVTFSREQEQQLIKLNKRVPKTVFEVKQIGKKSQQFEILELKEIIDKVIASPMERKILNLKMQGYSDLAIGEKLNYTKQRIQQIKSDIGKRILKELNDV